jgi:DNA topoisomerase-3
VVPPHFDLAPIDKAKSRLNAVVKLVKRKDVTRHHQRLRRGREGELIFRLIVQYAGGDKQHRQADPRLWLQSMTPQAIRDGFDSCAATSRCWAWPTPRAAAARPTGWWASTARAR